MSKPTIFNLPPEITCLIISQFDSAFGRLDDLLTLLRVFPHLIPFLTTAQIHAPDWKTRTIVHLLAKHKEDAELLATLIAMPTTDPNISFLPDHPIWPPSLDDGSYRTYRGWRTPLHTAVEAGNHAAVEVLLTHPSIDPNRDDEDGHTPIYVATQKGYLSVLQSLLSHPSTVVDTPVPPDEPFTTRRLISDMLRYSKAPLAVAARSGHTAIIALLLARPDISAHTRTEALSIAVDGGHVAIVALFLARNDVDLNAVSRCQYSTPLEVAIQRDHGDIVAMLLRRGDVRLARPRENVSRAPPLCQAVMDGNKDLVEMLFARDDMDPNVKEDDEIGGRTALAIAVEEGHVDIIAMLLAHEDLVADVPDANRCTPLNRAASLGRRDIVETLLGRDDVDPNWVPDKESEKGQPPLTVAAMEGHDEVVEILLKRGDLKVNQRDGHGMTALMWAIMKGEVEAARLLLLRKDVDVNARDPNEMPILSIATRFSAHMAPLLMQRDDLDVHARDKYGSTALATAAYSGDVETIALLLRRGLNVNTQDCNGFTPLMWAAKFGMAAAVKMLMECDGVDLNVCNVSGKSVLALTAESGKFETLKLLLGRSCVDVNARDGRGRTALALATTFKRSSKDGVDYDAVAKLLREHGGV
ncbi:hypothetical protein V492_00723 [Pseudogymnoascus sp. VKM F-4246]|nr:hypothetical protein V492_00723 [Pseudogymnoascus sp. VKM F-4246]